MEALKSRQEVPSAAKGWSIGAESKAYQNQHLRHLKTQQPCGLKLGAADDHELPKICQIPRLLIPVAGPKLARRT